MHLDVDIIYKLIENWKPVSRCFVWYNAESGPSSALQNFDLLPPFLFYTTFVAKIIIFLSFFQI